MTSASAQWPELYQLFMALHPDFREDFASVDAALDDQLAGTNTAQLREALEEWHQAFDGASDEAVAKTVQSFNSWWDADTLFGGHRQWADWVRVHLESELERRSVSG